MKKLLGLIMAISLILTGCSFQNNQRTNSKEQTQLIQKNKKVWKQKVKKSKTVKFPGEQIITVPTAYNDEDMSWSRLKSGNQLLVKAKVINLQPELKRVLTPETKASIYIEKVISGDNSFEGKTVKTEFSGGLIYAKNYLVNVEGQYTGDQFDIKNPQTIVYGKKGTKPMPQIGQTIVVGLNKYRANNEHRKKMYQDLGLSKDFYTLNNPEVTFWIKKNGNYRLNNPAFYQKGNRAKYPHIFKITKHLDQKY